MSRWIVFFILLALIAYEIVSRSHQVLEFVLTAAEAAFGYEGAACGAIGTNRQR